MTSPAFTPVKLYKLPTLGFLLALLTVVVSLWLTEMIAPEWALPMVFLILLGVVLIRKGLADQLQSLFGGK